MKRRVKKRTTPKGTKHACSVGWGVGLKVLVVRGGGVLCFVVLFPGASWCGCVWWLNGGRGGGMGAGKGVGVHN